MQASPAKQCWPWRRAWPLAPARSVVRGVRRLVVARCKEVGELLDRPFGEGDRGRSGFASDAHAGLFVEDGTVEPPQSAVVQSVRAMGSGVGEVVHVRKGFRHNLSLNFKLLASFHP